MELPMVFAQHRKRLSHFATGCLLVLCAMPVSAFEQLTAAQALIYDTGHLGNTHEGEIIKYHFTATDSAGDNITDVATLTIAKALPEGRRDVELNFLTDNRHLPLPAFPAYRGNPIIIAMFEHVAQTMGSATGGGTLYFRNRIRNALADKNIIVASGTAQYAEQAVETSNISFSPFTNDTNLDKTSVLRDSVFTVRFSDSVPAGVVAIEVKAHSGEQQFSRILSLE